MKSTNIFFVVWTLSVKASIDSVYCLKQCPVTFFLSRSLRRNFHWPKKLIEVKIIFFLTIKHVFFQINVWDFLHEGMSYRSTLVNFWKLSYSVLCQFGSSHQKPYIQLIIISFSVSTPMFYQTTLWVSD